MRIEAEFTAARAFSALLPKWPAIRRNGLIVFKKHPIRAWRLLASPPHE
jgi:hypothetical protein